MRNVFDNYAQKSKRVTNNIDLLCFSKKLLSSSFNLNFCQQFIAELASICSDFGLVQFDKND